MKTRFSLAILMSFVLLIGILPAHAQRPPQAATTLFDDEAEITFRDEFDGASLSDKWIATTKKASVDNGQLTIEASSDAADTVLRPGIGEDQGVLVLFQYTRGTMDFRFESGKEGTEDYRRWSFANNNGWLSQFYLGKSPYNLRQANLSENGWYYLLMRVGTDGTFYSNVWERDNPVEYTYSYERKLTQAGWDDATWDFAIHVKKGQLRVGRYEELNFKSGFTMPDAPILHPDDILFSEDFEHFDFKDWDNAGTSVVEMLDGDQALKMSKKQFMSSKDISSWDDYSFLIDTKVTQVDGQYNAFQILGRATNDQTYSVSLDVGNYQAYLSVFTDGEFKKVSNGNGSNLRRNTWHTLRFRMVGSDLKLFVDNHLIAYGTDDLISAGGVGFGVAPAAIVYFDNIRIVSMRP